MRIKIYCIGKTNEAYLEKGINEYLKRLKHYTNIEYEEIKDIKSIHDPNTLKLKESEAFLSKITKDDVLVLLDEMGQEYSSMQFASFIEKLTNQSVKNLVFIIGGAFGHHSILKEKANFTISLSKMTFSHQMVRLIAMEQLYRAYSIIRNEKYHNP